MISATTRVLYIAPSLPAFPTVAYRRYELFNRLAGLYDITLIGPQSASSTQVDELRERGITVQSVPVAPSSQPAGSSFDRAMRQLGVRVPNALMPQPSLLRGNNTTVLRQHALRAIQTRDYDILHIEMPLAHWLHGLKNLPPVIVEYEAVLSLLYKRQARLEQRLRSKTWLSLDAWKLARYEGFAAARACACVTTSSFESRTLRRLFPQAHTYEVPNGVDTTHYTLSPHDARDPATLLFIGTMNYPPNADAMVWFATQILPSIQRREPRARLRIIGPSPRPDVQELAALPGVEVMGKIDDLRPHLAAATVFIVPLRSGAGTKGKILQALAMGKAVVTTHIGVEGLDIGPSEVVIADESRSFANAVLALLGNPRRAEALGVSGRKRVVALYDWDACATQLGRVYDIVAARVNGVPER